MMLRNILTHRNPRVNKQVFLSSQILSKTVGSNSNARPYFTFMDRMKDAFRVPMKHLEALVEPSGKNYESQMPQTEQLYGNTAMSFNAYLTHNSYEMNIWHDMNNTVHNQFGTVDNPVLIFTSDSSWRIVICMGPGVEDDSSSHEKMYYFLREGPMNRCHLCGQCFKLVRLKNEFSEVNDYYTVMFSSLTNYAISEEDLDAPLMTLFSDRPAPNYQSQAAGNVYIHVNPDEADHMMVDPAYKMEKMKEATEKLYAVLAAFQMVESQVSKYIYKVPAPMSRTVYSNWYHIEKSIRKLDRWFLKIEKFQSRQFTDPDNHERREARMLERKRERWTDNYTYFFGGLSEEEQMYRDYYQTDLEEDPEDDKRDELIDEMEMARTGWFKFDRFDFVEASLLHEAHEALDDIVDQKLFKYKYRM